MKEIIVSVLKSEIHNLYCDNCFGNYNEAICDVCRKQSYGDCLVEEKANEIAEKIIDALKRND